MRKFVLAVVLAVVFLPRLVAAEPEHTPAAISAALKAVSAARILHHMRVLASDEFEGRAPGTPGERKTVTYLVGQFRGMGLKPGGADGTYLQRVPLVGVTSRARSTFTGQGRTLAFETPKSFVAISRHASSAVDVENAEAVFVGYGVDAPEYGWDDYKGLDCRGKILFMLVNDPQVADPSDAAKLDPKLFKGPEMTWYGRWVYKYLVASQKGAAGVVLLHDDRLAGYPFEVVSASMSAENLNIERAGERRVKIEAWADPAVSKELIEMGGQNLDDLRVRANRRDFRPVPLALRATFKLTNCVRRITSNNVVARVDGTDPAAGCVIYSAHWDHLGRDRGLSGHQIYNGALDNASGTATLLEIAHAYAGLKAKRTVVFLATTAEETGLLGAAYYTENPIYPIRSTAADINLDIVNAWGPTRDVTTITRGLSPALDDALQAAAVAQQRTVKDRPSLSGGLYRADHLPFLQVGVPAYDYGIGTDFIGRPPQWGAQQRQAYTKNDYHKVTDTIKPWFDMRGAARDARLLIELGWRLAEAPSLPQLAPGGEFKPR